MTALQCLSPSSSFGSSPTRNAHAYLTQTDYHYKPLSTTVILHIAADTIRLVHVIPCLNPELQSTSPHLIPDVDMSDMLVSLEKGAAEKEKWEKSRVGVSTTLEMQNLAGVRWQARLNWSISPDRGMHRTALTCTLCDGVGSCVCGPSPGCRGQV